MPQTLRANTHSPVPELAQQAGKEKGKQSSAQAWWEMPHIGSVCCPREERGRNCARERKWRWEPPTGKQIFTPKAKTFLLQSTTGSAQSLLQPPTCKRLHIPLATVLHSGSPAKSTKVSNSSQNTAMKPFSHQRRGCATSFQAAENNFGPQQCLLHSQKAIRQAVPLHGASP